MDDLSSEEKVHLQVLLYSKLNGIAAGTIPDLTLVDIVEQTARTRNLPNIPSDLQLPVFFANRAAINAACCAAAKTSQSMLVTRLIVFYRLDTAHQFQRYHDSHRWNVGIFLALLSLPRDSLSERTGNSYIRGGVRGGAVHFAPAARRFVTAYLHAVMEHYHTPKEFEARERFIRLWKNDGEAGGYEFFSFGASQRKILKVEMKRLTKEWEKEVDCMMRIMDPAEYEARVAKFVGVLFPGRADQRGTRQFAACGIAGQKSVVPAVEKTSVGDGGVVMHRENELLEALKVPSGVVKTKIEGTATWSEPAATVTEIRDAIAALQGSKPAEMLRMLMELFPASVVSEPWGTL